MKQVILEKNFFPNIKKLLNDYSDIYWIDTRTEIQKIDNYEDLFCDRIHFTEKGNKVVARVIKKIIDLKKLTYKPMISGDFSNLFVISKIIEFLFV